MAAPVDPIALLLDDFERLPQRQRRETLASLRHASAAFRRFERAGTWCVLATFGGVGLLACTLILIMNFGLYDGAVQLALAGDFAVMVVLGAVVGRRRDRLMCAAIAAHAYDVGMVSVEPDPVERDALP